MPSVPTTQVEVRPSLSPHYKDIFEFTRLDGAIHIYDIEQVVLAAA